MNISSSQTTYLLVDSGSALKGDCSASLEVEDMEDPDVSILSAKNSCFSSEHWRNRTRSSSHTKAISFNNPLQMLKFADLNSFPLRIEQPFGLELR